MKSKLILGFICVCTMLLSCNNDDDNESEPLTLNIKWSLSNVSGGLVGADDTFDYGVIVWDFDEDSSTLTVVNNNLDNTMYDILQSGTYSFSINTIDDTDFLMVDGTGMGRIDLFIDEFFLDQNLTVDGFLIRFERFEINIP